MVFETSLYKVWHNMQMNHAGSRCMLFDHNTKGYIYIRIHILYMCVYMDKRCWFKCRLFHEALSKRCCLILEATL